MKRSILVYGLFVPALAVALFFLIVPTTSQGLMQRRFANGETYAAFTEYMDARFAVRGLHFALARADSRERAAAAGGDRSGLLVRTDSGVSEETRLLVSRIAQAELDSLGASVPVYPVAVVVMIDPSQLTTPYMRAVVLPEQEGSRCTVVLRLSGRHPRLRAIVSTDRLLGTCGFYAVHGAPGAGMRAWLNETRLAAAGFLQRPASLGDGRVRDPAEANASGRMREMAACRTGRLDGCERLFTEPADNEPGWPRLKSDVDTVAMDVLVTTPTALGAPRVGMTAGLMSAMAHDLGRERFGAVWRSDLPPLEAFEKSEGRRLAAWIHDRVRTTIVDYHAGPGLRATQWLSLFTLMALAALAGVRLSKGELT